MVTVAVDGVISAPTVLVNPPGRSIPSNVTQKLSISSTISSLTIPTLNATVVVAVGTGTVMTVVPKSDGVPADFGL